MTSDDVEQVGRCEWCGDGVYVDQDHRRDGGYVWHDECAETNAQVIESADHVAAV